MIRIVERYIFGSFLTAFVFAFLVLSTALSVGGLGESVHLVGRGMPLLLVLRICVLALPEVLPWSAPLAALVSSLLVFARLSSDGELMAMRTCGVGVWTMIRLPVAFGIVCMAIGCWMANAVAPRGHLIRKTLQVEVLSSVGLQALEPGHTYVLSSGLKLGFERRGESGFYGLTVFERMKDGTERKLTADYAACERRGKALDLHLRGVSSESTVGGREMVVRADSLRQTVDVSRLCKTYERRHRDCGLGELVANIRSSSDLLQKICAQRKIPPETLRAFVRKNISEAKVEISRRFALALAPLCFILVGMSLGMRSRQKLSGFALAGTLVLLFGYYMPIILADAMSNVIWLHPELLPFVPAVACVALSVWLLKDMR